MKFMVRSIISAYSSFHPSSSLLSSVSAMLDEGPFIVYFTLSYFFFLLWEIYHCITGDNLPFSIWRKKAMQGYFKEDPTKTQWGSGNEGAPLCFQAGIQNYAINYTRHGGWEERDECKSKILVPQLVFQGTAQRFMQRDDFRMKETLYNL